MVTNEQRRTAVMQAMDSAGITERSARRFTGFARSSQRYLARRAPRRELRERLHTLAISRPRSGYRRLHILLRREAHAINHKLTRRLYREEGLAVRRRKRKRVAVAHVVKPMVTPCNERWSMDFVRDTVGDGGVFRALAVVVQCSPIQRDSFG